MCGISGIVHLDERQAEVETLDRMIATLHHRGPDAHGTFVRGPAGLAHARLSIIDLSGGRQPMHSANGHLALTFNGEIFNYLELREELIAKGHRFATRSDTEVILHLYQEYGRDCVHRMNGQWAFAIWDAQKQELFLSRDRLGIRPLFYTRTAKSLVFASEIKALLTLPEVDRRIDPQALDQLFTFWSPLPPRTIFQNIQELPPGHNLTLRAGRVEVTPYWSLDYQPETNERSADDWADELRELLIDATRLRLRSDVPVGAYLSGGLDSSLTTGMIRRFTDAPLKTYSVSFSDPDFDESGFQGDVIKLLGTDHREVRCTYDDIGRIFPTVIAHTERPVLRTAPAPMFLLSRLVRQDGTKVVMTGEGADEMLGGYDIFKEAKVRRFWARQPDSAYRPLLLKRLYPYMKNLQSQSPAYLKAFFNVRPEDLASPFFSHLPRWDLTARIKMFYSADLKDRLRNYDPLADYARQLPAAYESWHPFCQSQYLEASGLMPGYILCSQGDRMGMGNSVEGRFPFLDYRVAEFASRVPIRLKMRGLDEKHLLKRAAGDLVPDSVRKRPKQPYRAPDALSFFNPETKSARFEYVEELLSAEKIAEHGLFHPQAVERLVKKVRQGQAIGTKDNMAVVGILSAQLVAEQYVNGHTVTADPIGRKSANHDSLVTVSSGESACTSGMS